MRARATKVDWAKIKREYVTTNITLRDLASKYKVSFNSLGIHSRKEEWVKDKTEFLNARVDYNATELGHKRAKADEKIMDNIEKVISRCAEKLEEFAENSKSSKDTKDILDASKTIQEILHNRTANPRRLKELEMRIAKLSAETDAIVNQDKIDKTVTVKFENAEWMSNDDNTSEAESETD